MFEVIERTNDVGRRGYVVRNTETGHELGFHRFYDDAVSHMRKLVNARVSRLRAANVRNMQANKG